MFEEADIPFTEALCREYKQKVRSLALHYTTDHDLLKDLMQEGYIGLRKACDQYIDERGTSFSTYAHYKIRAEMQQYLRSSVAVVRYPRYIPAEAIEDIDLHKNQCMVNSIDYTDLLDMLEELDDDEREYIIRHYIMGETQTSIAEDKGVSRVPIKARIDSALFKLREKAGR